VLLPDYKHIAHPPPKQKPTYHPSLIKRYHVFKVVVASEKPLTFEVYTRHNFEHMIATIIPII